jgi:DNA-binding transcriptional LysR family regulator
VLDGVSLDQLRTFIAAAEEGNFSAAGRRLRRAQSVVSQTLANLEGQIGVRLFDRGGRVPTLTDEGRALLARARAVAAEVDLFKARAKGLANGLETELSLVADAMFPVTVLACAAAAFQVQFPGIPLRLHVEMWEAVADPILDGRCAIGLMGSLPPAPPQFSRERLLSVRAIKVVSPRHPLAAHGAPIPMSVLNEHIQLVHADHANVWRAGRFGLLSPRIWRLCDLAAKHHFLRAGFGFGIMPLHMVDEDLASGALVEIKVEDDPPEGHAIVMSAVYLTNSPLGPAGRWFVDRIKQEAASRIKGNASTSSDSFDVLPIANRTAAQSRVAASSLDRPRLYPVSDCGRAIENRDPRKETGQETGRRSAP